MTTRRILEETNVPGGAIVGFGDGYVEIEEMKKSRRLRHRHRLRRIYP